MLPDLQDTIVALSTAPGPGARAIVRLSGCDVQAIAGKVFEGPWTPRRAGRSFAANSVRLPGLYSPLPMEILHWPPPKTYTGQELLECHTFSCPPLIDLLVARFLDAGARPALPGEFTMRAFLAGKLDLTQAEAVLGVIEAGHRDELKQALAQLAGGMTRPLQKLREDLLDLLADVEAALDFSDEDIQFVHQRELLNRIAQGLAHLTLVRKQIEERSIAPRPFRVVLAGPPNVGKSSLFNALVGKNAALVSSIPGTTRDYLIHTLEIGGIKIDLVDTAGSRPADNLIEATAQTLGREQALQADLVLLCQETGGARSVEWRAQSAERGTQIGKVGDPEELEPALGAPCSAQHVLHLATKCDLASAESGLLPTSARTGAGLENLCKVLAEKARRHARPALAPSLSRCRHHVDAALDRLRQAHALVLGQQQPELLALELRLALDEMGAMVGAVYTDDLLDRIFSRFCIGK